jgi:signal transduction histidine kinase
VRRTGPTGTINLPMTRRRDLTTLGYRRIVTLLVYLVIVPGVMLSGVGVLLLMLKKSSYNLLIGILMLSFSGTLVTGVILVWVFLRRERNLSELQADFVSKVSHELRTPLTSIRMFTETLVLRRGDKVSEDRCIEALNRESTTSPGSSTRRSMPSSRRGRPATSRWWSRCRPSSHGCGATRARSWTRW